MNNNGGKISTTSSKVDKVTQVRILVVDDDKICLAVTASVLKLFNYEVVTINCPLEALSTLRMNQDSFDIILSDVHMPLMNGLNFQRIVEIEFHIPVILMSADDKKNILLKSLENGAAFFIVKPPSISDLKNIWQYVISRKKVTSIKSSLVKEIEPCNEIVNINFKGEIFPKTTSYANNESFASDHQKKPLNVEKVENITEEKTACSNSKKPKLIWTTALHNKFLEAISVIGTSRAVPKKILEYMNIPGLTRENIASHLQKYRIYVRRLNDSNGSMQHGMPLNWNERPFRSSFSWSQFPTLANNSFLLKYSNTTNNNQPQERTSMSNYDSPPNPFLQPNNPFVQPSLNNINVDNLNYNNLTQPMNILESSILDPQNNKIYDNKGELTNVALQFVSPKSDTYSNNVEKHHNGGSLRMTRHALDYNSNPIHLSFAINNDINFTTNGPMGPSQPQITSQEYRYFDGSFDKIGNNSTQLSRFIAHNNAENYFMRQPVVNISSNFINNEELPVTSLNIISTDQQAMVTSELNVISTAQPEETPNISNTSTQQVVVANISNADHQSCDAKEKDTTTFKFTGTTSSTPVQDWAPNHLDDFSVEYGMEDLSTIFPNIDAPNENKK